MATGKCPKCEKLVTRLDIHGLEAGVAFGKKWNAITYNCPFCFTVLGAQIDPIAIKTDIVEELAKRLGR